MFRKHCCNFFLYFFYPNFCAGRGLNGPILTVIEGFHCNIVSALLTWTCGHQQFCLVANRGSDGEADADHRSQSAANDRHHHCPVPRESRGWCHDGEQNHLRQIQDWGSVLFWNGNGGGENGWVFKDVLGKLLSLLLLQHTDSCFLKGVFIIIIFVKIIVGTSSKRK